MKTYTQPTIATKKAIVSAYKSGTGGTALSKMFGYSRASIHTWVRQDRDGNMGRRQRPGSGRSAKLQRAQIKRLLRILKQPASKFGFETDLWNTVRIRIVCRKKLKITASRMAIWRVLKRFDQSFKKVQKQYYEVDRDAQARWVERELPKIRAAVRKYRAILYFEDESSIALSPVMGKSWGPVGEKIVHKATGNRGSIAAISAISSDGRLVFNLFGGGKRFRSADIIAFLRQLLSHHKSRHLVVVMDQASCHKSKMVMAFVEREKRLHVFHLPPRSPEFNPDEQVWSHLKHHDLKSHQETNLKGLKKLTRRKLSSLSKNEAKLRGIFRRCEKALLYL
jgi:transposase